MKVRLTRKGTIICGVFLCVTVLALCVFLMKYFFREDVERHETEYTASYDGILQGDTSETEGDGEREVGAETSSEPVKYEEPRFPKDYKVILFFDENDASIKLSQYRKIDEFIEVANLFPESQVVISGHAAVSGDAEAGMAMSQSRAEAVADFMKHEGVDDLRMDVRYYGFEQPVTQGSDGQNRRLSMRVELSLTEE